MDVCAGTAARLASGWVEFPNLFGDKGLRIPINDTAFTIGTFEVKWYGIIICAAVILCISLALHACEKHGIKQDDLLDYILFAIPAAIIGARAFYVAFNFDLYRDDWKSIFDYWQGGLAVYGGVIAALLAAFFVARHKKQSFLKIAGFAAPYIILGQAIGRWGNFFNQEAYGGPTKMPWGMTGNEISEEVIAYARSGVPGFETGSLVHPTFFYESVWCLLVFIFIMIYRRKWEKTEGESLCLYMILYGAERIIVEGLRTDSLYIGHTNIRISQLLSGILIVAGIALFIDIRRRWKNALYEGGDLPEASGGLAGVVEKLKDAGGDPTEGTGEAALSADQPKNTDDEKQ